MCDNHVIIMLCSCEDYHTAFLYTARVKDNQKERMTREMNTDANHTLPRLESDMAIRDRIFTIRDVQVILDRDLAELYGVPTGTLNQAVKRNKNRFPEHFMFQLSVDEFRKWKSQIVISNLQESTVRMGLCKRPWDARALVLKLIVRARRSIFLIDNWATPEVLDLFARKRDGVQHSHIFALMCSHIPGVSLCRAAAFCRVRQSALDCAFFGL